MKKYSDSFSKVFSGGIGLLGIYGYIENKKVSSVSNQLAQEQVEALKIVAAKYDTLTLLQQKDVSEINTSIIPKISPEIEEQGKRFSLEFQDAASILRDVYGKFSDALSQLRDKKLSLTEEILYLRDLIKQCDTMKDKLDESKIITEKLLDILINKGLGSGKSDFLDNLLNSFNSFRELLSSLSIEQQGAISHLLLAVFMLLCLFSIISILYGDFLIRKFNLEGKYPKLAKFIEIRRKFQHFYLVMNFTFIILVLIVIIYVNYIVLTL